MESIHFKLKYCWQAHMDSIKSLQVIDEPLCLLTSSQDMSVRLWSVTGAEMGILVYPPNQKKKMMKNAVKWHFKVCVRAIRVLDWRLLRTHHRKYTFRPDYFSG